ncbi:c-type cytochrome [Mucilaginibacter sp. KACC 22063]|uniref:c-type cytochrome n=1 Tax=Mucilaginibacter sp. KACC 22063 TaxID=3025666 RepID=UPI002366D0D9|nr:c-type cytochrome [Mucilaginibacter sp. KACC 22063]WDF54022.1 c-type cytochrome [Mucilaginibacter sp. KACC 22063]
MKKTLSILSLAAFCTLMAACGGGQKSDKVSTDTTVATDQNAVAHNSDAAQDTTGSAGNEKTGGSVASSSKGAQLIAQNDCLTCHKEHDKLVGPAYADVAKKYNSGDIDKLADKVIKGGSGSWGEVPMSAHPSLSVDDAKEMVKYILTVK